MIITKERQGWEYLQDLISLGILHFTPKNRVLDVGCGFPINLFWLFHKHSIVRLVGIDINLKENIHDFADPCLNGLPLIPQIRELSNKLYNDYWNYAYHILKAPPLLILSSEEFEAVFKLYFSKPTSEYLKEAKMRNEHFHLIILSDCLHLFKLDEAFSILTDALSLLEERGLILVKVITQGEVDKPKNGFCQYGLDNMRNRIEVLYEFPFEEGVVLAGRKFKS